MPSSQLLCRTVRSSTRITNLAAFKQSARITSSRDPVRVVLWAAGIILAALAAALRPGGLAAAARVTAGPFVTLAAIILASTLAGRIGVFRILARTLIPDRGPAIASTAAILALTALLSALVNLDVAVVVATPLAMRAAQNQALPAGRLAVAVAITANATSFLLPTSNITSLLLLAHRPLATTAYLSRSWLPWMLVTAVTLGPLSAWTAHNTTSRAPAATAEQSPAVAAGPPARAASGLLPMYLTASAIRTLLGTGLILHGSLTGQLGQATVLAAVAGNLPAAAAMTPASMPGLWAAILATTIGPNLLITGSVATLICRQIARDAGARLGTRQFTAIGLALIPAQFAMATLGLHITAALT